MARRRKAMAGLLHLDFAHPSGTCGRLMKNGDIPASAA